MALDYVHSSSIQEFDKETEQVILLCWSFPCSTPFLSVFWTLQ